jgi:ketosteroid isomerase-like protein
MSQENVELVRQGFEAALREDWDTATAAFNPAVEWVEMPSLGPDASTYTGIRELRGAIQRWTEMWSEYPAEVARYADGGDEVVVLIRERGRDGLSGAAVEPELRAQEVTRRSASFALAAGEGPLPARYCTSQDAVGDEAIHDRRLRCRVDLWRCCYVCHGDPHPA